MGRAISRLIRWVLLPLGAVLVVFLVGMRTKSSPVLTAVRRVNRVFSNPRAMKTAGTPGAYASVIRHVGRTSGRSYETPVGAVATEDGFVIALPYGRQADWLKNVLASGSATVVHEGETSAVEQPEVVSINDMASHFSAQEQRAHRAFGVDECLRLSRVSATSST